MSGDVVLVLATLPRSLGAQKRLTRPILATEEIRSMHMPPQTAQTNGANDSIKSPFWRCPKRAEHLALAFRPTTCGQRAKAEIYYWLRARQILETRECSCAGKSVSWAEVMAFYDALDAEVGLVQPVPRHSAPPAHKGQRLAGLVGQVCGGEF